MSGVLLLAPDFALILVGAGLRRWMHLGDHFWAGLEKLVYFVLFPALLINAISRTPIELASAGPLFACGLAAMGTGALLAAAVRPLFASPIAFASRFQCAFRFNTYVGLAIAGKLHGAEGLAAMGILAGAMVPFANLVSVWALARHGESGLWRELVRNPLIWATAVGLALNLAGWRLPEPAQHFFGRLADASIALGLLAVGAALRLRGLAGARLASGWLAVVKLFAVPLAGWWSARWFGLAGVYFDTVVLFGALPAATSAYILTVRMNGDGAGVAWLISATTLAAMVTLPLWASLLTGTG